MSNQEIKGSGGIMPKSMMLFFKKPVNVAEEESLTVKYFPNYNFQEGAANLIEFNIPPIDNVYLNLSKSQLCVNVKIVDENNELFKFEGDREDWDAIPIDNVLHSLFSSVIVKFKDQTIGTGGTYYHYKSMIESIIESSAPKKLYGNHMIGFTGNKEWDMTRHIANSDSYAMRKKFFPNGKGEFRGRLNADIFKQEKNIVNNVPIKISLTQTKDAFRIMTFTKELDSKGNPLTFPAKLVITDIHLEIEQVFPTPETLLATECMLDKGENIYYQMKDTIITTRNIDDGIAHKQYEDLFSGKTPTQMIVGFVDAEAFIGNFYKNPYRFQDFGLSEIEFTINGTPTPCEGMKLDFENDVYLEGLASLYKVAGSLFKSKDIGIERKQYKNGVALFGFDIDPTFSQDYAYLGMAKGGRARLNLRFKTGLTQKIVMIVYAVFPQVYEIGKDRKAREYMNNY